MRTIARSTAVSPRGFGRRRPAVAVARAKVMPSDDIRLFLWTFAAGFLAVSIFLA